jgi:hypothetical protein
MLRDYTDPNCTSPFTHFTENGGGGNAAQSLLSADKMPEFCGQNRRLKFWRFLLSGRCLATSGQNFWTPF